MAGVAALVTRWAGAEGIAIGLAEGDLGGWIPALAPAVEGFALGGEVAPVAAIPSAGEEAVGRAKVVLENDGELGDGQRGGGAVGAGVSGESAEAMTVDGLGDDGCAADGLGGVDFPLIGAEVERLFRLAGAVCGDAGLGLNTAGGRRDWKIWGC